jgi:hypothetical protein
MDGLRLVVFDARDLGWFRPLSAGADREADGAERSRFGLSPIWRAGAALHGAARVADASLGAASWGEALAWLVGTASRRGRPIASVQFWGHGGWGRMNMGRTVFDAGAFAAGSALADSIRELRRSLAGPEALVWFRCCSAFGASGRAFARAAADALGCRVAGHTHIIGFFQSGTHSLRPGEAPGWGPTEGVAYRSAGGGATNATPRPIGALKSSPLRPNTITCLQPDLPAGF